MAIVGSATVVGRDLKEALSGSDLSVEDVRLLSVDEAEAPGLHATLTDFAGEAVVETPLSADELREVDVTFVCDARAWSMPALAASRYLVDLSGAGAEGPAVVSGVNEEALAEGRVFRSPHAATVLLASVLAGIRALGPFRASATVVLGAADAGQRGMDELMDQTRAALTFTAVPTDVLGHQLAFNLVPPFDRAGGRPTREARITGELRSVLGVDLPLAVVQVPFFFSVGACVWIDVGRAGGREELLSILARSPHVTLALDGDASPVGIAGHDDVLVGSVEEATGGGVWLWAICDNARRGAGLNAVEMAQALRRQRDGDPGAHEPRS